MRISAVKLTNFRCFAGEEVSFSPYTAIVGPNNSGKSTVLRALDIFFRSNQRTNAFLMSDFNDPANPLRISVVFSDLSSQAEEEFQHYCRHGKLEFFILAKADSNSISATIHGTRLGIPEFADFHAAGSAVEKKRVYTKLRLQFPLLPPIQQRSAVEVFRSALQTFEQDNQPLCKSIDSEDLAFGAGGIAAKLRKHIEWVYIPAVKDAVEESAENRNSAFSVLVNRLVRSKVDVDAKVDEIKKAAHTEMRSLTRAYKREITTLQQQLDREFRTLTASDAHVSLDWAETAHDSVGLTLPEIRSTLKDDLFEGEVGLFGHGLQRNYLVALVHLNAKVGGEATPSIVLAIEEPEIYQHPPQARYLQAALKEISKTDQVLLTTHSPYFVSALTFEDVRVVRKAPGKKPAVSSWTVEEQSSLIAAAMHEKPISREATLAKLEQFLQPEMNEAFFAGRVVFVEGNEDKAILVAYLTALGLHEKFLRRGGHLVGANGKANMIQMIAMARGFQTPYFVMFDADTDCKEKDRALNKRQNGLLAELVGLVREENEWPTEDKMHPNAVIWKESIQAAIVGDCTDWGERLQKACEELELGYDKLRKNPTVLGTTLARVVGEGVQLNALNRAATKIIEFVER